MSDDSSQSSESTVVPIKTEANLIVEPEPEIAAIPLQTCAFDCSTEDTKVCIKCHRHYCYIHASRFSPNFCQDCFKNLALILDKFERRVDDYDDIGDVVYTRKESCKRLRLDGPDWVFYTAWIENLTDEELGAVYEFHFFVLKMIEHDNEIRKIKNNAKVRNSKFVVGGLSMTTTTDKKTKREIKAKDPRKELKKLFPMMTDDQIEQMIATMNG